MYEEVLRIPLVLAGPGIPVDRVTTPVSQVDLFPTLATLLGAPLADDRVDGVSLVTGGEPLGARPPVLAMATLWDRERLAVVDGSRKLILNTGDTRGKLTLIGPHPPTTRLELYDLEADPGERADRSSADPAAAAALEERLLDRRAGFVFEDLEQLVVPDEVTENLRVLGYLE